MHHTGGPAGALRFGGLHLRHGRNRRCRPQSRRCVRSGRAPCGHRNAAPINQADIGSASPSSAAVRLAVPHQHRAAQPTGDAQPPPAPRRFFPVGTPSPSGLTPRRANPQLRGGVWSRAERFSQTREPDAAASTRKMPGRGPARTWPPIWRDFNRVLAADLSRLAAISSGGEMLRACNGRADLDNGHRLPIWAAYKMNTAIAIGFGSVCSPCASGSFSCAPFLRTLGAHVYFSNPSFCSCFRTR